MYDDKTNSETGDDKEELPPDEGWAGEPGEDLLVVRQLVVIVPIF
jgi:hypothetical protein